LEKRPRALRGFRLSFFARGRVELTQGLQGSQPLAGCEPPFPPPSMASASEGVMCRFGGSLPGGRQLRCAWKAIVAEDAEARWELRRVLPDLGLKETRHCHVSRHVRLLWPAWECSVMAFGLDPCSCMGLSRRAQSAAGGGQEATAEQEHWLATGALCVVLARAAHARRSQADRERASLCGCWWLQRCCPAHCLADNLMEPRDAQLSAPREPQGSLPQSEAP
jgi:hypothetical protein